MKRREFIVSASVTLAGVLTSYKASAQDPSIDPYGRPQSLLWERQDDHWNGFIYMTDEIIPKRWMARVYPVGRHYAGWLIERVPSPTVHEGEGWHTVRNEMRKHGMDIAWVRDKSTNREVFTTFDGVVDALNVRYREHWLSSSSVSIVPIVPIASET